MPEPDAAPNESSAGLIVEQEPTARSGVSPGSPCQVSTTVFETATGAPTWEHGLVVGSGSVGAVVFGPADRQVVSLSHERFFLRNGSLIDHVHRDFYRGGRGALPVSGLQHVQLAALDGELEVLGVAVVRLEALRDPLELRVRLRQLAILREDRGFRCGRHSSPSLAVRQHTVRTFQDYEKRPASG